MTRSQARAVGLGPLLALLALTAVFFSTTVSAVPTFEILRRQTACTTARPYSYSGKCYSSCPSGTYYSLKASTSGTKVCVLTPKCTGDGFSTTFNKSLESCVCRPGRYLKDSKCLICSTTFKYSSTCTAEGPTTCLTGIQVVGNACGCSDSTKAVRRLVSTGAYTCATCTEAFGAGVKTCGSDSVTTCEENFTRANSKSCVCSKSGFVTWNGKCLPACVGEQQRDSTGVCKMNCGDGKYLASPGATTCSSCSDAFGDNIKTCDTTGILTCKDTFSKDIVSGATICRCAASQYTKTDSNGVSTCIACSTFDPKASKCTETGATECLPPYKVLTDRTPNVCGCDSGSFDDGSVCKPCTAQHAQATQCNRNAITQCAPSWKPSTDGKLCTGFKYDKTAKACTCLENSGRFLNENSTTKDGKQLESTGNNGELCSPVCVDDQSRNPETFACDVECSDGKFYSGEGTTCTFCDAQFTGASTCTADGPSTCKDGFILTDDNKCTPCSDPSLPFGSAAETCNAEQGALTCNSQNGYVVVTPEQLKRRRLAKREPLRLQYCGCPDGQFDNGEKCAPCTQANVGTCTKATDNDNGILTCKDTYTLVTADDGSKTCECSDSTWETTDKDGNKKCQDCKELDIAGHALQCFDGRVSLCPNPYMIVFDKNIDKKYYCGCSKDQTMYDKDGGCHACSEMDANALTCSNKAVTTCKPLWKPGTGAAANTCVRDLTCTDGQYDDLSDKGCQACPFGGLGAHIKACGTDGSAVTACMDTFTQTGNTCACKSDEYLDPETTTCKKCLDKAGFEHALTCNANQVLSCSEPWEVVGNQCVRNLVCPKGKFDDGTNDQCQTCMSRYQDNAVTECTNTQVVACAEGFDLDTTSSAQSCKCDTNEYRLYPASAVGANVVAKCGSCTSDFDPKATTCTADNGATHCLDGYDVLDNAGTGADRCGCLPGKFDNGNACQTCGSDVRAHASQCTATTVTECADGWKIGLDNNSCVRSFTCSDGEYDDGTATTCQTCTGSNVKTCDSNGVPSSCIENLVTNADHQCACPTGTYLGAKDGALDRPYCRACTEFDANAVECSPQGVTKCSGSALQPVAGPSTGPFAGIPVCGCTDPTTYQDGSNYDNHVASTCQACSNFGANVATCSFEKGITSCTPKMTLTGTKADGDQKCACLASEMVMTVNGVDTCTDYNTCDPVEECTTGEPLYDAQTNTCSACPTEEPFYDGSACQAKATCTDSDQPKLNEATNQCEACPTGTPFYDGSACQAKATCTDSAKPKLNEATNQCEACPTGTPFYDTSDPSNSACVAYKSCTDENPVLDTSTNTCGKCPEGLPFYDKTTDPSNPTCVAQPTCDVDSATPLVSPIDNTCKACSAVDTENEAAAIYYNKFRQSRPRFDSASSDADLLTLRA
ncbi:hypothetical protein OIO90_005459 [Microbotryomycetes sp. JL221]|nr:hypothetical protein OIO90_005459 [Microbotryomycetes sp. JL221]